MFGFTLSYFEGDYNATNSIPENARFEAKLNNSAVANTAPNLFNGNIRLMTLSISQFGNTPMAYAYKYDQLNRLMSMNAWNNYDSTNNLWNTTGTALNAYHNRFTYDANGNILTQVRRGNATTLGMDSLTYQYYPNTNQLKRVIDGVTASNYTDDIDNQTDTNYRYDAIGNLVKDTAEQISNIEWTVYGKIRKITRISGSTKPDLEFEYTPDGHRAVKIVKPKDGSISIYTYYVRDAQGNIMATYTRNFSKTIDYDNITYTQINNKIIEKAGEDAFANFTKTYSNNAGLNTSLLNSVSDDSLLLKTFNPNLLLTNHDNALTTALTNISNLDFVKIFTGKNIDFQELCNCFENRQINNPDVFLNLKQGLLLSNNGIQILMDYIANISLGDLKTLSNDINYSGNEERQDRIDFIKNYLLDNSVGVELLQEQRNNFAVLLANYYNFDNCDNQKLSTALNTAFQLDRNFVLGAMADLDGIRDVFYNEHSEFSCDLRINTTDAIDLLSNNPETVWNALLQSQNAAYWLTWLKNNDPDFLYHAAFKYPNLVSNYQTNNNLYGGAYNGKQNYFVNLRNGLGQSIYDQIITFFLGQSSLYIDSMNLSEWHIYGSSRLGIYQTNVNLAYRNIHIVNGVATDSSGVTLTNRSYALYSLVRGAKRYELTNHLGNVLVVLSDKKLQTCSTNVVTSYIADVVSATDYSPGGAPLAGRSYTAPNSSYRFAFTGIEKDNEINGDGNMYATAFRELDTRLVTWWSIDPLTEQYPSHSPYNYTEGNPIVYTDRTGKGKESTHTDKEGKVVAVYDDGDNGVYKHDDLSNFKPETQSLAKFGKGVSKMGETVTPLSFADFEAYQKDGTVKVGLGAKIDFNSNWATEKVYSILKSNPTAGEYALKARGGREWDIKSKTPNGSYYYGSLLFGKYASARDAGNFAAGAVAQISSVPNGIIDYGFGTYNQSGNNVGKSLLKIATDILLIPVAPQYGIPSVINTIVNGEDKLSKAGIEAGKAYIKRLKK